jgi:hypothetical protein
MITVDAMPTELFSAVVTATKKSVRKRIKREQLSPLMIILQIDFLLLRSNEKSRKRRKPNAIQLLTC